MAFQVVFEGLAQDSPEERERIKEKLVEKFKVPPDKAERMVTAAPLVVKKGLNEEQAHKYQEALLAIGARASIRPMEESADNASPSDNAASHRATTAPPDAAAVNLANPVVAATPPLTPTPAAAPNATTTGDTTAGSELAVATTAIVSAFPTTPITANSDSEVPIFYTPADDLPPQPLTPKAPPPPNPYLMEVATVTAPATPPHTAADPLKTQMGVGQTATITPFGKSQWWQTVKVLNTPYDEQSRAVTPLSSGRVTANPIGFTIAHPSMDAVRYESIILVTAYQVGSGRQMWYGVDIFTKVSPRPVRINIDLLNIASFGWPESSDHLSRLDSFVCLLIERQPQLVLDLATYRFLKDNTRIKGIDTDRDLEKYCGKLQSEIDQGLSATTNNNIISCAQAQGLLNTPDPWARPVAMGQSPSPMPTQAINPQARPTNPMNMPPMPPSTAPPPPYPAANAAFPPNPNNQRPTAHYPGANNPYSPPAPPPPVPNAAPIRLSTDQYPRAGVYGGAQAAPPAYQQPYPPPLPFANAPTNYPSASPLGSGLPYAANTYAPANAAELEQAQVSARQSLWYAIGGFACCFPLAIVGLIKAENALKIFQQYNIENNDQERAKIAKYIAIFVLVMHALATITAIFK